MSLFCCVVFAKNLRNCWSCMDKSFAIFILFHCKIWIILNVCVSIPSQRDIAILHDFQDCMRQFYAVCLAHDSASFEFCMFWSWFFVFKWVIWRIEVWNSVIFLHVVKLWFCPWKELCFLCKYYSFVFGRHDWNFACLHDFWIAWFEIFCLLDFGLQESHALIAWYLIYWSSCFDCLQLDCMICMVGLPDAWLCDLHVCIEWFLIAWFVCLNSVCICMYWSHVLFFLLQWTRIVCLSHWQNSI